MTKRVLVVDDEADLTRLLAFNLSEAGFAVETVATGEAAMAAITRERPSVVVLDLMLPDVSGMEVCRRLRATIGSPTPRSSCSPRAATNTTASSASRSAPTTTS